MVDVARRPTIETSQFLGLARFEADIASKLPRVAQLQATLENARGDAEARAAGRRLSDVADLRLCKLAGDPRKFGASAWLAGIANT